MRLWEARDLSRVRLHELVSLIKAKDVGGINALFSDYAISEEDYKNDRGP